MASKKKTRPSFKKTRKQRHRDDTPSQAGPPFLIDETVSVPKETAAAVAEYYEMTTPEELRPNIQGCLDDSEEGPLSDCPPSPVQRPDYAGLLRQGQSDFT